MAVITVVPHDSPQIKSSFGYICVPCAHRLLGKSPEDVDRAISRSIFSPWEVSQDAEPKCICIVCGGATELVKATGRFEPAKKYAWVVKDDVLEGQNTKDNG